MGEDEVYPPLALYDTARERELRRLYPQPDVQWKVVLPSGRVHVFASIEEAREVQTALERPHLGRETLMDGPAPITINADGTTAAIDLGTHTVSIPLIQGPQGPPGVIYHDETYIPGTRVVPAVRFEIDGWEYSFPSKEAARKVQDRLNGMILEGEL